MSYFVSKEKLTELRAKYKPGTKIILKKMDDPQAPPIGTVGVVNFVDDAGQLQMKWETGSSLALISDVDEFEIVK